VKAPEVHARAVVLEDLDSGQVLFASHPNDERPLASTTKIMTALLVLSGMAPRDVVTVSAAAGEEGSAGAGFSEVGLHAGERLTVADLLYGLLLQSANDAAVALADAVSGTTARFVQAMNRRARAIGLEHTAFFSPNGLDDRGHSTARELAAITRLAFEQPVFRRVIRAKFHRIPAPGGGERRVQNRNVLLWLYPGAIGGKTGFTTAAGFCLVAAAERDGVRLVTVLLGDVSSNQVFDDAATLLDYGFHSFEERTLAREGQALQPIPAGTGSLQVEAGATLTRLVPRDAGSVRRVLKVRPGLELPLPAGTRVGTVRFFAGRRPLGIVPLLVPRQRTTPSGGPPPTPPPVVPGGGTTTGVWWIRGLGAAFSFGFHAAITLLG
jgi:serine-type D-Ala-D-Ala carboxypeptidase (penicillin-binding protein 5/6)